MGCGWYRDAVLPARGAHRPALRGRPGRRARPRGDRRRRRDRRSGPGSSARSGRTSRGSRRPRSASIARPPGPPAGPAWRSRPTRSCRPVGLAQLRVFEEEGADPARVVIGHADSYPSLDHYLEIVRRGANVEFDFLGMSFTPSSARASRGSSGLVHRAARARSRATGSCSARTSATTASSSTTTGTATSTSTSRSCPACATAGASEAGHHPADRHQPGADPDDRPEAARRAQARGEGRLHR